MVPISVGGLQQNRGLTNASHVAVAVRERAVAFVEKRAAGAHAARRPVFEWAHAAYTRVRPAANLRARQPLVACPELDCLRHRLPPAAEKRAAQLGVGADR